MKKKFVAVGLALAMAVSVMPDDYCVGLAQSVNADVSSDYDEGSVMPDALFEYEVVDGCAHIESLDLRRYWNGTEYLNMDRI